MLSNVEKFFMSVQSSLLKRMFKIFWYYIKKNCETRSGSQQPIHEYYCINNKIFKVTCTRNSPCLCTKKINWICNLCLSIGRYYFCKRHYYVWGHLVAKSSVISQYSILKDQCFHDLNKLKVQTLLQKSMLHHFIFSTLLIIISY